MQWAAIHLEWLALETQLTYTAQLRQLRAAGCSWLSYTLQRMHCMQSCRLYGRQHQASWSSGHFQGGRLVPGLDSSSPALQAVPSQAAPCVHAAGLSGHISHSLQEAGAGYDV